MNSPTSKHMINFADLSPLARSLFPLGVDEHTGYLAIAHHDDDAMQTACADYDRYSTGSDSPPEPYNIIRGYGRIDEHNERVDWSVNPGDGLEPMTIAVGQW